MPTTVFEYKVRDSNGKLIKGKIESESITAVGNKLRSMGYIPFVLMRLLRFSEQAICNRTWAGT